jgi:hypothetical protein
LGKAIADCNSQATQDTFVLPGNKGEVTLDHCYKGRAHLRCALTALATEANALTASYTKIVKAGYADINSVDDVCRIDRETLASDIVGSEDFRKRFGALKNQYEATLKCASSVKAAFKDVALNDMAKPPEILQSMTSSIDGDVTAVTEAQSQVADLAAKMELTKKAMQTLSKLHHAMCNLFLDEKKGTTDQSVR